MRYRQMKEKQSQQQSINYVTLTNKCNCISFWRFFATLLFGVIHVRQKTALASFAYCLILSDIVMKKTQPNIHEKNQREDTGQCFIPVP